jgi:hypothetical protein
MRNRTEATRMRLPSPALIVACVSLVVALGGVSYAATVLPANSELGEHDGDHADLPSQRTPKPTALVDRHEDRRTEDCGSHGASMTCPRTAVRSKTSTGSARS